jgi:hypothetical protein
VAGIATAAAGDYTSAMRGLICYLLLLYGCLISGAVGQDKSAARRLEATTPKLRSTLQALKDRGASRTTLSHQLADEIMSMAESGHQPSRPAVTSFAEELTSALLGKELTNAQVIMLEQSIDEVLRSSGATFTSASRLRETLGSVGVDASRLQIITKRFIAVGEEVRGPDDLPVTSVQ